MQNVIPVHKKGNREDVENYRPISLLCIVSKVMERCILNHMFPTLKNSLHHLQHGFMKGKSCATQMVDFVHTLGKSLDNKIQIDVLYLDFSKAFDSVPHHLLLHKMKSFGINGQLHAWFTNYLSDRRQCILVEGETSEWKPVISGVPQGSILGPFLFLLYINDLPKPPSNETTMFLFADDSKCFREIHSNADASALQRDIDKLFLWSNIWGMKFNAEKCSVLTVSRSRSPVIFEYNMNNTPLKHVSSQK